MHKLKILKKEKKEKRKNVLVSNNKRPFINKKKLKVY